MNDSVTRSDAEQWLRTLAILNGDDPDATIRNLIGAGSIGITNIQAIREYADSRATFLRDAIRPENFDNLDEARKSALIDLLIYFDFLDADIRALDIADEAERIERDARLRQAVLEYYESNQEEPELNIISEIIIAIAELFGLGDQARSMFHVTDDVPEQSVDASGSLMGAVTLANSLIGSHESGGSNRGEIVRLVSGGREGQAWCGDFVNYVMDQVDEGLFDQSNPSRALSFEELANPLGAFRDNPRARPNVGDVVSFDRGGSGRGHVGIVTAVDGDVVTYVSGNYGNAVDDATYRLSAPPSSLRGTVDVQALAVARGIHLDDSDDVPSPRATPVRVAEHRDADFWRG